MSQTQWAWPVVFPTLIIILLPASIVDGFTTRTMVFCLLFWLTRELRTGIREYLLGRQAHAQGARLAPQVYSALPFGFSIVRQRSRAFQSGTPDDSVAQFRKFPSIQVIRTREFGKETIHTLSHLDAKHVLTSGFSKWGKPPNFMTSFEPLLGAGIFASDQKGPWSWHRALTRPHFAQQRVGDVDAIEEHAARVVVWLEKKAETQEMVDIQDVFSRFTITVGTQHLFAQCVDTLNDLFADRVAKDVDIDGKEFLQAWSEAQEHCVRRMMMPPLVRSLLHRIQGPNKAIQGVFKVVDGLVIKSNGTDPEKHGLFGEPEGAGNLLDHLRQSGCSAEMLRHELINILLAARDTTTSLLTSCVYELARREDLWKELRAEVEVLRNVRFISLEQVRKLKFLRALINETLRLHPPVWFNIRHALEDDVLPSGIFVPAGTDCRFFIREFQRDPELWGKDAAEFVPHRWLDGRQVTQSKDPFSFQPFSAGPRICLGQQFAYTEASIALTRIVLAFSKVELAEPSSLSFKEAPGVTLSVRGGLWVKFHK
ncbi:hypothetical protein CROQUDRAFT_669713 [Cronartium quercuum f. sp. fusiforme G11]|uniref:Cytochrome P450 n=1 Tax=Cronartium quercuum f. sp. fusiforme G11 TaxID=708437 RepID=A0A9P6NSR8_9BASI|nr:hypothetical protein CROQUDRAFT_669713 [Cronartium quercuum f. sp. fusiforme G11]